MLSIARYVLSILLLCVQKHFFGREVMSRPVVPIVFGTGTIFSGLILGVTYLCRKWTTSGWVKVVVWPC